MQYACCLYEENKSGSIVNELAKMFTKNNLSRGRLQLRLDALVRHLRRALTLFRMGAVVIFGITQKLL